MFKKCILLLHCSQKDRFFKKLFFSILRIMILLLAFYRNENSVLLDRVSHLSDTKRMWIFAQTMNTNKIPTEK